MQSRHDRDNYLLLNKDNINPDNFGDFSKETPERNENYNLPYDYGSIMHYHAWGFAKDISKPTMVPKDEKYIRTLGSRVLSFYDKLLMNTHYGCLDKCDKNTAAKCTNGGFPHPKNCSECICPGGYGGALCDQRPKGCGKVVRVTSTSPRKLNLFVGELREGEVSRECTYWLEAPAGSKVEVKLISLSNWGIIGGCHIGGIEFKTQADQKATGYRFCTKSDIGTTLLSSSNRVPVMAYNHESVFEATIEYKVVKPR
ncbi:astacin [Ancylostoma caninum]|uniref:Metalloendopeptidase n=1 Tax=Ancylostoma caninum TaxID=29170 RepID=A0A368GS76_ANCCA|nr:astacin [Ancylostoma caninum]RCN47226.1 astacin [Ancylostoma caninum]